jgi:hypothetical protein
MEKFNLIGNHVTMEFEQLAKSVELTGRSLEEMVSSSQSSKFNRGKEVN